MCFMLPVAQSVKYKDFQPLQFIKLFFGNTAAIGHVCKIANSVSENCCGTVKVFDWSNFSVPNIKFIKSNNFCINMRYPASFICFGVKNIGKRAPDNFDCFRIAVNVNGFSMKLVDLADVIQSHDMVNMIM